MLPSNIYSDREFQTWPSWQVVYEWEDILAEKLNLKILNSQKACITTAFFDRAIAHLSRRLNLSRETVFSRVDALTLKKKFLYFSMNPRSSFDFSTSKHSIPIIIDFWKDTNLDAFYKSYRNCKYILISSLEVFDFLKKNQCSLNIYHFPLSLPDQYRITNHSVFNKKYDVVLVGRRNLVLWEYLQKYEKEHPSIEYLYQEQINEELYYVSNKTGVVGKFHSRESYFELLKSARISFYSTPGIDGGEARTGGFNPITPRLFEILAAGCHLIARYPQNEETTYFQLNNLCPSIDSYFLFEQELGRALSEKSPPIQRNVEYLDKHYTSKRIDLLNEILVQIN